VLAAMVHSDMTGSREEEAAAGPSVHVRSRPPRRDNCGAGLMSRVTGQSRKAADIEEDDEMTNSFVSSKRRCLSDREEGLVGGLMAGCDLGDSPSGRPCGRRKVEEMFSSLTTDRPGEESDTRLSPKMQRGNFLTTRTSPSAQMSSSPPNVPDFSGASNTSSPVLAHAPSPHLFSSPTLASKPSPEVDMAGSVSAIGSEQSQPSGPTSIGTGGDPIGAAACTVMADSSDSISFTRASSGKRNMRRGSEKDGCDIEPQKPRLFE